MNYEELQTLLGGLGASIVIAVIVLLALATILMPLYVIRINDKLKTLTKLQQAQLDELRALRGTLARPGTPVNR